MIQTVAKFGGVSVGSVDAVHRVTAIIKANPELRLVVVSAAAGVTNMLTELCRCEPSARQQVINQILKLHSNLANDLGLDIQDKIDRHMTRLCISNGPISMAEIDAILSVGEDLSCLIVHAYLHSQGLSITHLDARDYIITDDNFNQAAPNLEEIRKRVRSMPAGLCIIHGFIGSTIDNRTTTLGREGSDHSAALLAEALKADKLLIYKDVRGIYTGDPKTMPSAQLIPHLSFQQMQEIANAGAKVLHPATLSTCARSRIPITVLSTFEPDKPGTTINTVIEEVC
jgi:aspartate kinase